MATGPICGTFASRSGSLAELDTQLELAVRLEMLTASKLVSAGAEVARTGQLLHGLERALRRRADRMSLACVGVIGIAASAAAWLLAS
jgi:hypothetical protein